MDVKRIITGIMILVIIVIVSVFYTLNYNSPLLPMTAGERSLRRLYIIKSYDPENDLYTSFIPAIVNSIVWDFRALDTYFETIVFFTALISALAIYHEYLIEAKWDREKLSPIPMRISKLILPMTFSISIAIVIKSMVSPGGGFQGGALAALSIYVIIYVHSSSYLIGKLNHSLLLFIRSIAILCISFLAILPLLNIIMGDCYGYLFQIYSKPECDFGALINIYGCSVSLVPLIYNVFEYLAIFSGFTLLLLIIIIGGYRERIS